MLDHGEVKEKYNQLQSYTDTALLFGVTRQRIHQIVTGYTTIAQSVGKRKGLWEQKNSRASLIRKLRQKPCIKCEGIIKVIHHKDGNSRNNKPQNLMPLCFKCHGLLHRKDHKSKYDGKPCLFCKEPLLKKRYYSKSEGQFCNSVHRDHYNNPTRKFRIVIPADFKCIDCGKEEYNAKNRCKNCYHKYLYKVNPKRREYFKNYSKQYHIKKRIEKQSNIGIF